MRLTETDFNVGCVLSLHFESLQAAPEEDRPSPELAQYGKSAVDTASIPSESRYEYFSHQQLTHIIIIAILLQIQYFWIFEMLSLDFTIWTR